MRRKPSVDLYDGCRLLTASALVQCRNPKALSKEALSMGQRPFIPQEYDVFAGLDVDKKSIAVTFMNHQQGFIRSLHMPYSVEHLVKHVRKHLAIRKLPLRMRLDPPATDCMMGFWPRAITAWWRRHR